MGQLTSTIDPGDSHAESPRSEHPEIPALLIAWAAEEPHRVGEVALIEPGASAVLLGRGDSGGGGRLWFHRQRPGSSRRTPPLASPGLSREQLRVKLTGGRLRIDRIGKCPMEVNGERVDSALVQAGDMVLLRGQMLLYCTSRPYVLPAMRSASVDGAHAFGEPDAHGIVGESALAWRLRDELAWLGQVDQHTLILGESGSGKELCARAIHALSSRARGPFVARNAATIPPGIADAELFGNVKGYPNPGMPERPGLVGAADGGTLFLDEIGELPHALQANLLRVLDEGGEFHRLGGASFSRSRFRLLGATNRDPTALKHDLAARLVLRLVVPRLDERREDIPLLTRHLLGRAAENNPEATRRFLISNDGATPDLRTGSGLIQHLLRHDYTTNMRELDALLWRAMSGSRRDVIDWPPAGAAPSDASRDRPLIEPIRSSEAPPEEPDPPALDAEVSLPKEEEIRAALLVHRGNVVQTARALGMSSRYALYRLIRKYGIEVRG